ncbi:ER degradation-enhancing alpha-mannosidase [Thraustotheca clavata]|uniref:alpha-1,2-Mannosidase n=1 Tax=Thraustotheca clavata TaxID=74557 RepID=A0A1W0A071_9STRA|nr:ER degradation-enhancing alpha-mannosidase [Thraustotheca clavata]
MVREGVVVAFLALLVAVNGVMHWTEKLYLQNKAKEMFFHGYDSYMEHAFPWDELKPLSCQGRRWDRRERGDLDDALGGFALTLIDSLSMLAIVDRDRFAEAVHQVISTVSFNRDVTISVFETTIRIIGGLISAHMLASPDHVGLMPYNYNGELLDMAVDVANRLLPAFDTPTGIPRHRINLKHGVPKGTTAETCPAAAGSLLLEMSLLSRLSNISDFEDYAKGAVLELWNRRSGIHLLGSTINVETGNWVHTQSGIGAGLDSYYEYLMKYYIISGDTDWFNMFNQSYQSIELHLVHDGYHFEVDMNYGKEYLRSRRVSALQAFWPGLQVLAGDVPSAIKSHARLYDLWNQFGALPEIYDTAGEGEIIRWGRHYPLRPELAESTYHLYMATKDEKYLKVGRKLLYDIEETSRVACGYAAVANVQDKSLEDRMDSFFLSETMKYLYLLFSNDSSIIVPGYACNISSNQSAYSNPVHSSNVVFTTEGHLFLVTPSLYQDSASISKKRKHSSNSRTCLTPRRPTTSSSSKTNKKGVYAQAAVSIRHRDHHLMTFPASPALFGHSLQYDGHVDGPLFASFDIVGYACSDLTNLGAMLEGKIVLVKRGQCSFTRKAINLQAAGAIGMIAINTKVEAKSTKWQRFYSLSDDGNGKHVHIPVLMISRRDALQLQHDVVLHSGIGSEITVSLSTLLA